jgi:adenylate cyclase
MQKVSGTLSKTRKLILPLMMAVLSATVAFLLSRGIPFEVSFLKTAQLRTIDQRFEYRGPISLADTSKVVIVALTDQSFQALPNTLSFPRSYYARAVKNLYSAGAKVVGIDVIFDGASPLRGDDSVFASVLKKYPSTVLAVRNSISVSGRYAIFKSSDYFHNIFLSSDSSMGAVYVRNDADGVYRRYVPMVQFPTGPDQYRMVPSFGFEVVSRYLGLGNSLATDSSSFFELGGIKVPKYDAGSMLINYPGPNGNSPTFPTYDIWQVLDDSTFTTSDEADFGVQINAFDTLRDRNVFKNKIVLIGAEYPESGDLKPIPFLQDKAEEHSNLVYGVEIHASTIETLLDRDFYRPSTALVNFLEMFLGALLIAMTSFIFKSAKHSRMFLVIFVPLVVTAAMVFASYEAAYLLFVSKNLVMGIIYPILAYSFTYVSVVVYQFVSERRAKAAIKSLFSRYVDPSVVNQLVGNPDLVRLGGERKLMTVMFSDIANFTAVSEKLAPEDLVAHLNEYLTAMTEVVFQNAGTLDKYIGDAIVAFWGAPLELKDHAYHACRTAIEMTKRLDTLRAKWAEEGKPILSFRVGVNSGEMVVGNVGGRERFDYTVIGDNVNLASRLESANKMYRTRILLSEYSYELVKDRVFARELDLIVVKGKTKPVKIYELIGDEANPAGEDRKRLVEIYCTGLAKYRNREWGIAAELFEKALSIDSSDYPSEMYLERCKLYELEPPPAEWNGVFIMTTK